MSDIMVFLTVLVKAVNNISPIIKCCLEKHNNILYPPKFAAKYLLYIFDAIAVVKSTRNLAPRVSFYFSGCLSALVPNNPIGVLVSDVVLLIFRLLKLLRYLINL